MPNSALIGIAKLMRRAFASEDLNPTALQLVSRLQCNPNDANAAMDLCTIFELGGDPILALEFQSTALSVKQVYRSSSPAGKTPLRVLAIKGPGIIMDNMPIEFLVENSPVELHSLYVGQGVPVPEDIPEHDVAIVAICESDANQDLLKDLEPVIGQWPRPVLNRPAYIARLSRERIGPVVRNIDGLTFAESVRLSRCELSAWKDIASLRCLTASRHAEGLNHLHSCWIIRPVNSHAGHDLERFQSLEELQDYLGRTTSNEYYVAPFVAYASSDGIYRKYRIALIRGESYPVHMALSSRWMVHYLNADMLHNAEHRKEESKFMMRYESEFGARHRQTLRELSDALGLEYVVLDCAETPDGQLLLFEADNGAVVHSMDPIDLFPYKRPAMKKIFDAFQRLLDSSQDTARERGNYSRCA